MIKDIENINALMDLDGLLQRGLECYGQSGQLTTRMMCQNLSLTGNDLSRIVRFSERLGFDPEIIILYAWHQVLHIYSGARSTVVALASGVQSHGQWATGNGNGISVAAQILDNHLPRPSLEKIIEQMSTLVQSAPISINDSDVPIRFRSIVLRLPFDLVGSEIYDIPISNHRALILEYCLSDEALSVALRYDENYYSAQRISELALVLANVIESCTAIGPEFDNDYMPVLVPRYLALSALQNENRSDRVYLKNVTLHSLFESRVQVAPDAIAVIDDHESISYAQLESYANELAIYLKNEGFKQGKIVGVAVRKTARLVVTLLGILKAGGIYMPFPASYEKQRLDKMLVDGDPPFMIADSFFDEWSPEYIGKVLRIDMRTPADRKTPITPTQDPSPIDPDMLAYIMYTSGSTGEPKGVMISHRSVTNTIQDINVMLSVGPSDRALMISNVGFDLSVYDIFGLLAVGGAVVIPSEEEESNPAYLVKTIRDNAVTLWSSTPQLMDRLIGRLIRQGTVGQLSGLKRVLLSGDWIPLALPARIRQITNNQGVNIIGLGGATEGSIWSIYYQISDNCNNWRSIPYGRPLGNQRIYILDSDGNPLPKGAVGELFIGGLGVAIGYFKQSVLSENKFIRLTTSVDKDEKVDLGYLYRTGDIGRYLPDGNVEFLGRAGMVPVIDAIVAFPGYIESIITTTVKELDQCVVLAKPSEPKSLVCFYVSSDPIDESHTAANLKLRIPTTHLPTSYIRLNDIPLSRNGKLDRGGLLRLLT